MAGRTTTAPTDVKEYGSKKKEARSADALANATARAAQPEVPQAPPGTQQPAPQQAPAQAAAQQQGVMPTSLMQMVPPDILFRKNQARLPSQQQYDVGQLWSTLADSPTTDPLIRAIAKRLLREG